MVTAKVRPITVRFIYREMDEDKGTEESYIAEQFTLAVGKQTGWARNDNLPFSINFIEFDIPDYEYEIEQAENRGRWELLDELKNLGAEAMIEKMEEIYYNEDRQ